MNDTTTLCPHGKLYLCPDCSMHKRLDQLNRENLELKASLKEATLLLEGITHRNPCLYDGERFCVEHYHMDPCPHALARAYLANNTGTETVKAP